MTVGIAAICDGDDGEGPAVVLAADRLVTTGYSTRIEYEHTDTKIDEVLDTNPITAYGVAAGSLSYADDLFLNMESEILDSAPTTVRALAEEGVNAFHRLQKDAFNNQVLGPLGFSLEDFKNDELALSDEYQKAVLKDVFEKKDEIESNLSILLAGVDANGAHIYSVKGADFARHDPLGYATIGSGSLSAQLTFTRNRYDTGCSVDDALMTVVEAKKRAEEAQGVGTKMDIVIIRKDSVDFVKGDDVEPLRELQKDIEAAELKERRKTIEQKNIDEIIGDDDAT